MSLDGWYRARWSVPVDHRRWMLIQSHMEDWALRLRRMFRLSVPPSCVVFNTWGGDALACKPLAQVHQAAEQPQGTCRSGRWFQYPPTTPWNHCRQVRISRIGEGYDDIDDGDGNRMGSSDAAMVRSRKPWSSDSVLLWAALCWDSCRTSCIHIPKKTKQI